MALLTGILSILTAVPALFDAGRQVFETLTGTTPAATTPEALIAEVERLPADKQAAWASAMETQIRQYQAETARLSNEQGELTPEILKAIGPKAAAEVALLRMTTRPKVVLRMTHVVMLPFYVTVYDMAVTVLNNALSAFGTVHRFETLAGLFFKDGSIYAAMYEQAVWPCVVIVGGYMTLRQMEKASASPLDAIANAMSGVKGLFKRK